MDNRDIVQSSIDYIEENLKSEITVEELANKAGFSLFHYYRIFQGVVGMPIMQYVLNRRLANAIYEIDCGRKMIDVALEYGFNTHAGFFKAFRREYDCSPSQYLKGQTVKKPYKINLYQEEHIMITHKKIAKMLSHWGMENEKIADIYLNGTNKRCDNAWYVGNDYVIKATTNLSALKSHIEISKALEKVGLVAATPIAAKCGEDYLFEKDVCFSVTKRLKGECIKSEEMYEDDYSVKARYLGEIIGQLHLILAKHDKVIICNDNNLFETVSSWALDATKKVIELPESFYDDYIKTFGKLYTKLPRQIIHRDPSPGNIILEHGRLSGFIDFELTERNVRLFDPCYASTAILSESFAEDNAENLGKWVEIYRNIIFGYASVCKLSKEEKQALPYVIFSIQMICVAYFSETNKYAELADINIKMLQWLVENKEKLVIA